MSTIKLFSGNTFDLLNPQGSIFTVEDIAHALSNVCRFAGHTKTFYSVAQHSVLVSNYLPRHLALQGLLHDAAEAFLGDVTSPLKALLPDYQVLEKRVEEVIFKSFGLPLTLSPQVKHADRVLLVTEQRDFMNIVPASDADCADPETYIQPLPVKLTGWSQQSAKAVFMDRMAHLYQSN